MSDFIPGVGSGIKVAREIDDPHDKRTVQRMVSKFHDYVAGRMMKSAYGTKSAALMPSFSYVEIGQKGRRRDVQRGNVSADTSCM